LNKLWVIAYVPPITPDFEAGKGLSAKRLVACAKHLDVCESIQAVNRQRTVQKPPASQIDDVINSWRKLRVALQMVLEDPVAASRLVRCIHNPDPIIWGRVQHSACRQMLDLNKARAFKHCNNTPRDIFRPLSDVNAVTPQPNVVFGFPRVQKSEGSDV
jgi:hypothetical protein